jgi:hypothetical protein
MPMTDVKTNQAIWGRAFPIGGEWDAGYTPIRPGLLRGRFAARRMPGGWEVVFQPLNGEPEQLLGAFPPTEEGEIQAKKLAVEKLEEVWARTR